MSKIMQSALDPSCLMCLTPWGGGGWWSPLRQGVVWPGSPRNFATEPATWHDLAIKMAAIPDAHNWHIKIKIDIAATGTGTAQRILGNANSIGFFQWASGITYSWRYIYTADGTSRYIPIEPPSTGSGVIEFRFGQAEYPFISTDGVISSIVVTARAVAAYQMVANSSAFNGAILSLELWDDTTNALVWAYPSESERLRLITTNGNVIAGNQYFEAADPALTWSIKTALPAGITGTVLARINGECIVNPAQWNRTTATFTGAATDTLEFLTVFSETLAYEQIAYICGVKRWVIPVSAGNINIVTVGFQNLRWTFPDGSTSTAASINQAVTAGTVVCEYVGLLNGGLTINNSTALASSAMRAIDLPRVTNILALYSLSGLTGAAADLPRVTNYLTLYSLSGLTGAAADLPRVTNHLQLYNLHGLTGSTADLPRVTNYLNLVRLPGLTGSTADLPSNTGERRVYVTPYVTGALSVVATNTSIYHYATGATALEYDETVHNCVVAGGTGNTLHVGTGTSAGDADIQTLRDRGWSVTIH